MIAEVLHKITQDNMGIVAYTKPGILRWEKICLPESIQFWDIQSESSPDSKEKDIILMTGSNHRNFSFTVEYFCLGNKKRN